MANRSVYVALSEFCKGDKRPRQVLIDAGFNVLENTSGRRLQREELLELLRETDVVLAGVEPYDTELLAALPRLRCISRCGVGTDTIDLEAARRLNITVLTTRDEVIEPVAEMTVAMILALARNFPLHCSDFRAGDWIKRTGYLLSECTIGLIGFGRIGRRVEECLRAFGPRVVVTDPYVKRDNLPDNVELVDLPKLLAEADLISIHAARAASEGSIIGGREIARMKRGSRIVNTSRGYLVDEEALRQALESGHIAAAALDVFSEEPYRGRLSEFPQVLATPHVATLTRASRAAMERQSAQNIVDFFKSA